jgi:hypothetical protein
MSRRTPQEIDRQHAVAELRSIVSRIKESGSFAEISDLANKIQHIAYDVEDWAEHQNAGKPTRYGAIRQQRHDADAVLREALVYQGA